MNTTEKPVSTARQGNKTTRQDSMRVVLIAALGVGLALPATLRSMPKDESSEWAKVLAGVSSGQTATAVPETKSADMKTAKSGVAQKASKEASSKKDKPAVAKAVAQPSDWSKVVASLETSSAKAEPEKPQPTEEPKSSQPEEVVITAKSESKPAEPKNEEAAQSEQAATVAKAESSHLPALVDDVKSEPGAGESGDAGLQSTINRWKEKFSKVTYGTELEGFFDSSLSNRQNNPHVISAGAFEADFSKAFGKSFQQLHC